MRYHIITIFPDIMDSYITESIIGRAIESGLIEVTTYALRSYTSDKHGRVDGRVYGGGPGMVMWVDPIIECYQDVIKKIGKRKLKGQTVYDASKTLTVIFTPGKVQFNNEIAIDVAREYTDIIFICGRYEGIDSRVKDIIESVYGVVPPRVEEDRRRPELGSVCEWSVGPYVLTGGELPAMICIDAISRHIDGVLHNSESIEESRVSSHAMYGRPEVYAYKTLNDKGEKVTLEYKVPEVLLSGHHANIEKWKEGK